MPARARSETVIEGQVGVYHCIARCVRGAFLCGTDPCTGRYFGHRKEWVLNRARVLERLFAIEVCGYSIMSNQLDLVLCTRPDIADQWSDDEIALRWRRVCQRHDVLTDEPVGLSADDLAMITVDPEKLPERRQRLESLSWFMRRLCEPIARAANIEEQTGGKFWAGRFKAVALLDEEALEKVAQDWFSRSFDDGGEADLLSQVHLALAGMVNRRDAGNGRRARMGSSPPR